MTDTPKLTSTQRAIVRYCQKPKTAIEIAQLINCQRSNVHRHLRLLQRLDVIEKQKDPKYRSHNHGCTFVATGRGMTFDTDWMRYTPPAAEKAYKGHVVMGVRLG